MFWGPFTIKQWLKAELYVYKDVHTQKNKFTLVTETNSGYFKQKVGIGLFLDEYYYIMESKAKIHASKF